MENNISLLFLCQALHCLKSIKDGSIKVDEHNAYFLDDRRVKNTIIYLMIYSISKYRVIFLFLENGEYFAIDTKRNKAMFLDIKCKVLNWSCLHIANALRSQKEHRRRGWKHWDCSAWRREGSAGNNASVWVNDGREQRKGCQTHLSSTLWQEKRQWAQIKSPSNHKKSFYCEGDQTLEEVTILFIHLDTFKSQVSID